MLIWNEKGSVQNGDFPDQSQSFALLLARAIVVIVANKPLAVRGHVTNVSFKQALESY